MSNNERKYMPIHSGSRREFPALPSKIPMELLNEKQAETNHSQSLEVLASRGGLSPKEIVANILQISYFKMTFFSEAQCADYIIKKFEGWNL